MAIIEKGLMAALRKYIKDRISYTACPSQNASNGGACVLGNDACFFYDGGKCKTSRIEILKRNSFYEERTDGETDFGIYIGSSKW